MTDSLEPRGRAHPVLYDDLLAGGVSSGLGGVSFGLGGAVMGLTVGAALLRAVAVGLDTHAQCGAILALPLRTRPRRLTACSPPAAARRHTLSLYTALTPCYTAGVR